MPTQASRTFNNDKARRLGGFFSVEISFKPPPRRCLYYTFIERHMELLRRNIELRVRGAICLGLRLISGCLCQDVLCLSSRGRVFPDRNRVNTELLLIIAPKMFRHELKLRRTRNNKKYSRTVN